MVVVWFNMVLWITHKSEGCFSTDLIPLCNIDCVHRAGANTTGLILEKQNAWQEMWVLVVSIQDGDGDVGAGTEVLCSAHFLR